MRFLLSSASAVLLLVLPSLSAAAEDKTTSSAACTATSTLGSFYDLRPDTAVRPPASDSKTGRRASTIGHHPTVDYRARGYDYGSNFTLNICGPVVGDIDNVHGIDKGAWANISAYYVSKGDVYSLGSQSGALTPRGRKLVLQYKGGSPCGPKNEKRELTSGFGVDAGAYSTVKRSMSHEGATYRNYDDEDISKSADKAKDVKASAEQDKSQRRKSATISFLCDRDAATTTASFVAVDPDECAYFFEVRSEHACAGAEPHKPGSVGPGSVFAIILLIAVLVYLGGGIFYQRTVANARGWRQLPNYSLWSGIWTFISVSRLHLPLPSKFKMSG